MERQEKVAKLNGHDAETAPEPAGEAETAPGDGGGGGECGQDGEKSASRESTPATACGAESKDKDNDNREGGEERAEKDGGEKQGEGEANSSPNGTGTVTGSFEAPEAGETPSASSTDFPSEPAAAPPAPPAPAAPINLLESCAVCKQCLQNRDCEPKLLPCLHSFCLKCIPQPERQISVAVPGPHGQDTHIVNIMRCTVCYQEYKQTDMIDNYFVKDTTEVSSTSTEKSTQACTSCEDNASGIGFCVECGEWLCKTCIEAHQRVKFTKDHTIRKKEELTQESVSSSGQRTVFCPIHKQEALKLFCETCDKLTCRDCQLLEHKEHRYQFLEEAFQIQKGIIETFMSKLQEKKNFVQFSAAQVQNRLKEATETHKKVEHDIKVAVFTLINEINKKGKSLLQQLESMTKERTMKLFNQQQNINSMAQQILHVLRFTHWAISNGSSTALLYSKRLITYQLRHILKVPLDPIPPANGAVHFFCDPNFWAKNVVNLGNLVIEKVPPPAPHPANMMGQQISPGHNTAGKHPGQINLAQLRLQHMQQAALAQKQQQHQHQQQHQQQIQQQMRIASQMSQHPRQGGPPQIMQQQPPRLISMQLMQREGVNGTTQMYPPSHHLRMTSAQGRMPVAQPRLNGQPYPMMQPQLQRRHSNPGHAGPFPVASLHNVSAANPTSPTSASMASAHGHRGPTSPVVGPIELIPSVTNPENLPSLPDIPPIQLEDAGSSMLDNLLSRYINASTQPSLAPTNNLNASPGPSTHSPGSSGLSNSLTPARPSSSSSTGSRGSCGSAGRTATVNTAVDQVKVKQEPGVEEECGYSGASVKTERGKDGRRSACMMSSPETSATPPLPVLGSVSSGSVQDVLRTLGEHVKTEPQNTSCNSTNTPLTNGSMGTEAQGFSHRFQKGSSLQANANSQPGTEGKEDDPNEDWCAVCQNGGELLCCDRCPKVFHITCHIPTLRSLPSGDWMCTFCRNLTNPEMDYNCNDDPPNKKSDCGMSPEDQRKCERLLLYVFCHELSVEFQEPVPSSVPNYYKIIKNPMHLNLVKSKLQLKHLQHYQSPKEFVYDVRLVFSNCAKYNEADSEVAEAGKAVSVYFEEKLLEIYPDQSFPVEPEKRSREEEEQKNEDDSDDDIVQPKRKRLKNDEKLLHIK
ncbi:E3 ubiquitin-protein ligase TRIM33 isoform X2 [Hoplias malabaricus]|uniref:E3 ubiquitin-protein ligase TRIM33 isoform X2 n=1 Tax=Hoplias malabaricus TaxID=27720 RepID=UPI0034637BA9